MKPWFLAIAISLLVCIMPVTVYAQSADSTLNPQEIQTRAEVHFKEYSVKLLEFLEEHPDFLPTSKHPAIKEIDIKEVIDVKEMIKAEEDQLDISRAAIDNRSKDAKIHALESLAGAYQIETTNKLLRIKLYKVEQGSEKDKLFYQKAIEDALIVKPDFDIRKDSEYTLEGISQVIFQYGLMIAILHPPKKPLDSQSPVKGFIFGLLAGFVISALSLLVIWKLWKTKPIRVYQGQVYQNQKYNHR